MTCYRRSVTGTVPRESILVDKGDKDLTAVFEAVVPVHGLEILSKTSFNVKGQPMVNTPRDTVETFLGTGIDVLFLADALVTKI